MRNNLFEVVIILTLTIILIITVFRKDDKIEAQQQQLTFKQSIIDSLKRQINFDQIYINQIEHRPTVKNYDSVDGDIIEGNKIINK